MDQWLGEILRADSEGLLLFRRVLVGSPDRLNARLNSIPDVANRVQFLPAMSHMNFMNVFL